MKIYYINLTKRTYYSIYEEDEKCVVTIHAEDSEFLGAMKDDMVAYLTIHDIEYEFGVLFEDEVSFFKISKILPIQMYGIILGHILQMAEMDDKNTLINKILALSASKKDLEEYRIYREQRQESSKVN